MQILKQALPAIEKWEKKINKFPECNTLPLSSFIFKRKSFYNAEICYYWLTSSAEKHFQCTKISKNVFVILMGVLWSQKAWKSIVQSLRN